MGGESSLGDSSWNSDFGTHVPDEEEKRELFWPCL